MQMCGDATCESRSCSSEAMDTYLAQQGADARAYVRAALGLPADPGADTPGGTD
jgi:hypothetical protein